MLGFFKRFKKIAPGCNNKKTELKEGENIRCAWCGGNILPGDPITLYSPKKGFEIPEYAVVYKNNPLQLVGCLSDDCCRTGADRAGFWMNGKVQRVLSPLEEALMTGKVVIVDDIGDMRQAKSIKD